MTPQEEALSLAIRRLAWARCSETEEGWIPDPLLWEPVREAAVAYARPVVAEECARIVEDPTTNASNPVLLRALFAAAIREHGRSK